MRKRRLREAQQPAQVGLGSWLNVDLITQGFLEGPPWLWLQSPWPSLGPTQRI